MYLPRTDYRCWRGVPECFGDCCFSAASAFACAAGRVLFYVCGYQPRSLETHRLKSTFCNELEGIPAVLRRGESVLSEGGSNRRVAVVSSPKRRSHPVPSRNAPRSLQVTASRRVSIGSGSSTEGVRRSVRNSGSNRSSPHTPTSPLNPSITPTSPRRPSALEPEEEEEATNLREEGPLERAGELEFLAALGSHLARIEEGEARDEGEVTRTSSEVAAIQRAIPNGEGQVSIETSHASTEAPDCEQSSELPPSQLYQSTE